MINKIFNLFCILLVIAIPFAAVKAKSAAVPVSSDDTVVVYFSAKAHTQKIALEIAENLGCDIIEIVPKVAYTSKDLNYRVDNSRVTLENLDPHARPLIKNDNDLKKLDKYKRVILGSPIWFRRAPRIIETFLDNYDLKGKEIYSFVTSSGSPTYTFISELKEKYPNLNFINSIRFKDNDSGKVINEWLKQIK